MFRGVTVTTGTQEIENPFRDSYEDPEFITVAAPTDVAFSGGKFCGTYDPTGIHSADHDKYYLGMDNKLLYPTDEGFRVNAFRAYFEIADGASIKAFNLNLGDETGLDLIPALAQDDSAWYSLDGKRLSGKPCQKGIYIQNGKKVIIK